MKVNKGYSFNREWVKRQTEAQFLKHEAHSGLTEDQLKEAYRLIKGINAPAKADRDKSEKGAE